MRKLVYYIATTIDGFVAAPDGTVDFIPVEPALIAWISAHHPETLPAAYRDAIGLALPAEPRFDTVLMGRATYEPALAAGIDDPYAPLRTYVFSRTLEPRAGVEVVAGDPVGFVRDLKQQDGRDIWLCGGGDLAGQLLPEVDELIVKVNPIVAGSGVPVVRRDFEPAHFTPDGAEVLADGVIVLTYRRP